MGTGIARNPTKKPPSAAPVVLQRGRVEVVARGLLKQRPEIDRPSDRPVSAEQPHRVAGHLHQPRGRCRDLGVGGLDGLVLAVGLHILVEAQTAEYRGRLDRLRSRRRRDTSCPFRGELRKKFPSPACGGGQGGGMKPSLTGTWAVRT